MPAAPESSRCKERDWKGRTLCATMVPGGLVCQAFGKSRVGSPELSTFEATLFELRSRMSNWCGSQERLGHRMWSGSAGAPDRSAPGPQNASLAGLFLPPVSFKCCTP
jgi:hypothetical protein